MAPLLDPSPAEELCSRLLGGPPREPSAPRPVGGDRPEALLGQPAGPRGASPAAGEERRSRPTEAQPAAEEAGWRAEAGHAITIRAAGIGPRGGASAHGGGDPSPRGCRPEAPAIGRSWPCSWRRRPLHSCAGPDSALGATHTGAAAALRGGGSCPLGISAAPWRVSPCPSRGTRPGGGGRGA